MRVRRAWPGRSPRVARMRTPRNPPFSTLMRLFVDDRTERSGERTDHGLQNHRSGHFGAINRGVEQQVQAKHTEVIGIAGAMDIAQFPYRRLFADQPGRRCLHPQEC